MDKTRELVRDAYGKLARQQSPCCGPSTPCSCGEKPHADTGHPVPESELGLSCGDPAAFGCLNKGDVVLDLGCGAGKDVFLAAQKAGETGKAIGVDMTPEMIELARKHAAEFAEATGLCNVEFREGTIEELPIDDASVDVVISNCVINLSPDKSKVFGEAHRVLRPGGRMVVSDIVLNRPLPEAARKDAGLYVSCVAGALLRDDYLQAIRNAGFAGVDLLSDRTYAACRAGGDPITGPLADALAGVAASITVLALRGERAGSR
jgi:arsenite methyltransferase